MRTILALALTAIVTGAAAAAQPAPQNQIAPDRNCPPETRQNSTATQNNGATLSEKLASSRGVICPPGVDPAMTQPPPPEGTIKVVPPPGSPGGDPHMLPK